MVSPTFVLAEKAVGEEANSGQKNLTRPFSMKKRTLLFLFFFSKIAFSNGQLRPAQLDSLVMLVDRTMTTEWFCALTFREIPRHFLGGYPNGYELEADEKVDSILLFFTDLGKPYPVKKIVFASDSLILRHNDREKPKVDSIKNALVFWNKQPKATFSPEKKVENWRFGKIDEIEGQQLTRKLSDGRVEIIQRFDSVGHLIFFQGFSAPQKVHTYTCEWQNGQIVASKQVMTERDSITFFTSKIWSRDEKGHVKRLQYATSEGQNATDVSVVVVENSAKQTVINYVAFDEIHAIYTFDPHGNWIKHVIPKTEQVWERQIFYRPRG